MRCRKVEKLLPAFVDGELPEKISARVEDHLAQCSRCTELLALHRSLVGEWNQKQRLVPSKDLWPAIAAEIRVRAPERKRSRLAAWPKSNFGIPVPALGSALFVVLLAFGLLWYEHGYRPPRVSEPSARGVSMAESIMQANYSDAPQIFEAVATVLSETRGQKVDRLLPVKAKVVNQAILQLQDDPFFSEQLRPLLDDIEIALTELSAADRSESEATLRDVQQLIQEKDLLVRIAVAKSVLNVLLDGEKVPPEILAAYLQPPR